MEIKTINLSQKFQLFSDYWSPKIVGELNDAHIKLAKFQGEFIWHKHDHEDEMFLVTKGKLAIFLRDKELIIQEGEFAVIPKGVEHKPVAEEEVEVLLIEPKSTINTGGTEDVKTVRNLDWI